MNTIQWFKILKLTRFGPDTAKTMTQASPVNITTILNTNIKEVHFVISIRVCIAKTEIAIHRQAVITTATRTDWVS